MISKETTLGVSSLAVMLANKNLGVAPVDGTPLADLVAITKSVPFATTIPEGDYSLDQQLKDQAESLEFSTGAVDGVQSGHDKALDSYIEVVSTAIRKHITVAKNQVRPVVLEFAEAIQKAMGQDPVSASAAFCIDVVDLPLPMQNSGFEESVSKYAGKTVVTPQRDLKLGLRTIEQILELMLTGSKDYDNAVTHWFVSKPTSFFMTIWGNLFCDFQEASPVNVLKFEEFLADTDCGTDNALAIYLLSRKLFDEVPENTGMSLEVYSNTVAEFRDASAIFLSKVYDFYNASISNGVLVSKITGMRKVVKVNGPVYRGWLKTGGTNEVLLGMLVTSNSFYHTSIIDEKKDTFLSAWKDYEQLSNVVLKNNEFNRFKEACSIFFTESMKNMDEIETDFIRSNSGMNEKIQEYFKLTLNSLTTSDMQNIFDTALKLVCRSRFFYTDAEKILRGINEASLAHPEGDVRQAALMSVIEYTCDYVANQIKLTS